MAADVKAGIDPGPWVLIEPRPYDGDDEGLEGSFYTPGSIEAANGNPVCIFGDSFGSGTMYENAANARLISAAPCLLKALKEAAKTFRSYEQQHLAKATVEGHQKAAANAYRAKQCEAAIAKAEGRT